MRWGWRGAFLVTIAAGLAGCATGSAGYSEPEQARVDAYERAADQVLQSRGMKGPAPVVRIGTDPTLTGAGRPAGYYTDRSGFRDAGRSGTIVVNHAAMADDFIAQAVLSQELAHSTSLRIFRIRLNTFGPAKNSHNSILGFVGH